MPAKILTEAAVRLLKPANKRREIADARAAGLHLIIQASGTKSWALRFRRPDGRSAKLTLGPLDFSGSEVTADPVIGQPLTLHAARLLVANIQRQRKMGRDVVGEHAAATRRLRTAVAQADASTYGALVRVFIDEHAKPKVRRWREIARILGLDYPLDGGQPVETRDGLAERWADMAVARIDGNAIYQIVDEATRRGLPGIPRRNTGLSDARGRKMARALSKFFSWLLKHRRIVVNPALGSYCPPPPESRERVLAEDEIRWFWHACDAVGAPFGPMCQLLLLTGGRREEVRAMTRAEISADGATWTLAGSRTKNRKPHNVPLAPLAREVIAAAPRIEGKVVFTLDGQRPVANVHKGKTRLDAAMLAAARAERGEGTTIPPWRLHDLRRTAATGMAEIGIQPYIVEAALNHISGAKAGVAGIYNRAQYTDEKRAALERWATHIQGLVSGTPSNVVAMSPRKGV